MTAGVAGACRCHTKLAAVIPRRGYLVWASSGSSSAAADDVSEAEVSKVTGIAATAVVADSACRIGGPPADAAEDAMEKGRSPCA